MLNTTRPSRKILACPKSAFTLLGSSQSAFSVWRYQARACSFASRCSGLVSQNAFIVVIEIMRIKQIIVPFWDCRTMFIVLDVLIETHLSSLLGIVVGNRDPLKSALHGGATYPRFLWISLCASHAAGPPAQFLRGYPDSPAKQAASHSPRKVSPVRSGLASGPSAPHATFQVPAVATASPRDILLSPHPAQTDFPATL